MRKHHVVGGKTVDVKKAISRSDLGSSRGSGGRGGGRWGGGGDSWGGRGGGGWGGGGKGILIF